MAKGIPEQILIICDLVDRRVAIGFDLSKMHIRNLNCNSRVRAKSEKLIDTEKLILKRLASLPPTDNSLQSDSLSIDNIYQSNICECGVLRVTKVLLSDDYRVLVVSYVFSSGPILRRRGARYLFDADDAGRYEHRF